ncbi:glycosyltransferase family 4 protein [Candidatus Sumerlaeota bacterium]|nr:glycosyltransferase family 4 protein [Candidatus Sumerlaeota bacterium]
MTLKINGAQPRILLYMGGFALMGGIEIFARDLARLLTENGALVTLAYWPIRGESPLLREMRNFGVRMIRGQVTRGVSYGLPDACLFPLVRPELQETDQVIFLKLFSDRVMRWALDTISVRRKSSSQFTCRSIYVPSFCPEEDETYHDRRRPAPAILNRIDAIQAQCGKMERQCQSFLGYEGKIYQFPLLGSVRSSCASPLPPAGPELPIRIGYIGRLTRQKNVDALLSAFGLLLRDQGCKPTAPLELHIYGGGEAENTLRAHPAAVENPRAVFFHGSYHTSDIPKIASETHFFAQATRFEGQCLAALEVLACGRPLVATRAGCLDDVLADPCAGILVDPGKASALADAMGAMIGNIFEGRVLPEKIVEYHRQNFSFETVAPRYLQMCSELLGASQIEREVSA